MSGISKTKVPRKRQSNEESKRQQAFIRWFDHQYPKLSILLFASANGRHGGGKTIKYKGKDIPLSAIKSKKEGQRKGVADLYLSVPKVTYNEETTKHGLYIETKTDVGKQSEAQKEFQKAIEGQGYQYTICRSVDEFIKTINDYL